MVDKHDEEFGAGWEEAADMDPVTKDMNVDDSEIDRRDPEGA